MNSDDTDQRYRSEAEAWKCRYEALLQQVSSLQLTQPAPAMLANRESYELGKLHGAEAERKACIQICEDQVARSTKLIQKAKTVNIRASYSVTKVTAQLLAELIRARGKQ